MMSGGAMTMLSRSRPTSSITEYSCCQPFGRAIATGVACTSPPATTFSPLFTTSPVSGSTTGLLPWDTVLPGLDVPVVPVLDGTPVGELVFPRFWLRLFDPLLFDPLLFDPLLFDPELLFELLVGVSCLAPPVPVVHCA